MAAQKLKQRIRALLVKLHDLKSKKDGDYEQAHKDLQKEIQSLEEFVSALEIAESTEKQNDKLTAILEQAKEQIKELRAEIDKLTMPPSTYAIFSDYHESGVATVYVNGRKMKVSVHPAINTSLLKKGQEVILNEAFAIIEPCGFDRQGEVVRVKDMLEGGRVLVTLHFDEEKVATVADSLSETTLSVGDHLLYDARSGYVVEKLPKSEVEDLVLEEVPDISYEQIGGLEGAIEMVRDAVELPFLYPDLFAEHKLKPPKGVLLYGPPGCGKTLIAKAVANSIAKKLGHLSSKEMRSYFLHVKGPELLNKYVGESERQIREVFKKAKERAKEGHPVMVFFDEMDALFRTRGTGVSSDMESTIVPQFLSEIDGVEGLKNVIVIGASNRQDLIDPAVLRAGRLDVKVKVGRPDNPSNGFKIAKIYLTPDLPLPERYLSYIGKPYVAINRLHSLAPNEWEKVHEDLTPIRKEFNIQWCGEEKRPMTDNEFEALKARVVELNKDNPMRLEEHLKVLDGQRNVGWIYEEWRFNDKKDIVFYEIYRMIEGMYVQIPGKASESSKGLQWISRNGSLVPFDSRFLYVKYVTGNGEYLYHRDFLSGALIEGVIARAKKLAIKARIADPKNANGISVEHLYRAIREEFSESEDLPQTTTPDDWARIMGQAKEKISSVSKVDKTAFMSGKQIETIGAGHYV